MTYKEMTYKQLCNLQEALNHYYYEEFNRKEKIYSYTETIGLMYTVDDDGDELELLYNIDKNEIILNVNGSLFVGHYYDINSLIESLWWNSFDDFYSWALDLKEVIA